MKESSSSWDSRTYRVSTMRDSTGDAEEAAAVVVRPVVMAAFHPVENLCRLFVHELHVDGILIPARSADTHSVDHTVGVRESCRRSRGMKDRDQLQSTMNEGRNYTHKPSAVQT